MSRNTIDIIRKCRYRERIVQKNDNYIDAGEQQYYSDNFTDDEMRWWISQFAIGKVPDYQMAAWLMAVCFNGLSIQETSILTRCMVESGIQLQWPTTKYELKKLLLLPNTNDLDDNDDLLYFVDKHSSGGVGDKVSIVLAPLVASMGLYVPMIAGRGLGHTGGTIDKLESIVGMNVHLSMKEFQSIVLSVGCCITSATTEICPADSKLYSLRDVTCTVSSIPLQTSSIMCKKIAEKPNSIVLDVKYGTGSFQSTYDDALALAKNMISIGEYNGLQPTTALLTRMDTPLGCAVGNFLELFECIYVMVPSSYPTSIRTFDDLKTHCQYSNKTVVNDHNDQLRLSYDLIELILMQSAQMMYQSNKSDGQGYTECIVQSFDALRDGRALKKFKNMIAAQGGDRYTIEKCVHCIEAYNNKSCATSDGMSTASSLLPSLILSLIDTTSSSSSSSSNNTSKPVQVLEWQAATDGYITQIDALIVGQVCVELLHTGRLHQNDKIHKYTGIWFHKQIGDTVTTGDVIADIYYNNNDDDDSKSIPPTSTTSFDHSDSCITPTALIRRILERLNSSVTYSTDKPTSTRKPTHITHRVTSQLNVEDFPDFFPLN